jgi:hypothetical protein
MCSLFSFDGRFVLAGPFWSQLFFACALAGEDHRILMLGYHQATAFRLLAAQKRTLVSISWGLPTMILYEPHPRTGEGCVCIHSKGSII